MRIAVAGTHRIGKTTLVEAFARTHPGFAWEPEPWEQLHEELGESFLDELAPEAFERQLEHLCGRLASRTPGEDVIFDRSPLDLLAYLRASEELHGRRSGWDLPEETLALARAGVLRLDLVAYLPLPPVRARAESRPRGGRGGLRRRVDDYLEELIASDEPGLLGGPRAPAVVRLPGTTRRRLRRLSAWVEGSS